MAETRREQIEELTYPLGSVVRLTGLTPDTLRAWERRYGVVVPLRTPGGTRRYRASDLERLRLVKAAVDAGHRISHVAHLDRDALLQITAAAPPPERLGPDPTDAVFDALSRLDADEVERRIALQLAALGPTRFARELAPTLLERIGSAWARGELCIAAEHLATSVLRSLLGASLRPSASTGNGSAVVFATLPGERHEMGLLAAAIIASSAGARVVYLGPDLPVDQIAYAAYTTEAGAVAISMVSQEPEQALSLLRSLRSVLPREVELWLGGALARSAHDVPGVDWLESFEALEQRVKLHALGSGRPGL